MAIVEHFPLKTPREKQIKALEYVEKVINLGYKDVVISAPTGIGKSLIGATVCAWAKTQAQLPNQEGGYVLVMQKVLQDQIAAELSKLGGTASAYLLKGAVEYKCPTHKVCSVGRLRECELCRTGGCTYKLAKAEFLEAAYAVTNYAYFFTERAHVGDLGPRRVLVCDEAHNLPKAVTRFIQLEIAEDRMVDLAPTLEDDPRFREIQTREEFLAWANEAYLPAVKEQAELLAALADGGSVSTEDLKLAFEVEQHYLQSKLAIGQYQANEEDWAFWRSEDRGPVTLTLRPIEAAPYMDQMIRSAADVRIYMSAFLGPKAVFCRELGLDPKKVAWLGLSSSFSPESRPVVLATVGSMARSQLETTTPGVLRLIDKLLTKHEGERGLIHTNSYALADKVVEHLAQTGHATRVRYPKEAKERDSMIAEHRATDGSVLVSPSIGEGFDFKGDSARFQIIAKCPWPSLGDKQVAIKAERAPEWYKVEALKSLIQTCGRVCRDETDFGVTYILDEDAKRLLRETDHAVPAWFKEAVVYP